MSREKEFSALDSIPSARRRDVGDGPLAGTAGDRLSKANYGSSSAAVSFHLGEILT